MIPVTRITTGEDLLGYLPAGYRMVQAFGPDKDALVRAFDREADEQLRGQRVEFGGRATARYELATSSFVPEESAQALAALDALDDAFGGRPTASFVVEVLLFMPGLFKESKGDRALQVQSIEAIRALGQKAAAFKKLSKVRFWLLDGQASDGSTYVIDDIAALLRELSPSAMPSELESPHSSSSFLSLGARAVWFPRSAIVESLAQRFALRVFEREALPDQPGLRIPYALVAGECADFIADDVTPTLEQMEKDRASGEPIVPRVSYPSFSADEAVSMSMERVHKQVDDLMPQLDGVQARIEANRSWAADEMSTALITRTRRHADEADAHYGMAQAFLEVLRSGTSKIAPGEQIMSGRPKTLDEGFAPAIQFFESLALDGSDGYEDPDVLRKELDEQRKFITDKRKDLARLETRLEDGEDGIAVEIKALKEEIEAAEKEAAELEERRDAAIASKTGWRSKLEKPTYKATLKERLQDRIDAGIAAAAEEVESAAAEVEKTKIAVAKAEEEMRHMVVSIILRVVGLALGLVGVALVGALIVSGVMGLNIVWWSGLAALFAGPLAISLLNVWVIASIVAFVGYVILQVRKYFKLRRELAALHRRLEAQKAALVSRLRRYWDAYSRKFFGMCDWIRYGHVFDTDRQLETLVDEQVTAVRDYVQSIREMLGVAQEETEEFSLDSTVGEYVVVHRDWVDKLMADEGERVDREAAKYFAGEGRSRSRYLAAGVEELRHDLQSVCVEEVFAGFVPSGVVDAIQRYDYDLARAVDSVPVFLPLDATALKNTVCVVMGSDKEFLEAQTGGLATHVIVVPTEDVEHLLLLRVASDIKIDEVKALALT